MNERELYLKLKPHIARDFRPTAITQIITSGGGGSGATSFSGLSGTIANSQAPQFLLRDGTRSVTGHLLVDAGVTIDGVDISAHAADPNAHHAQQHSITGSDHTITGATLSLVGATSTDTLGLITPSAAPGTTESVLKATSGLLTLPSFTATTSMRTPLIDTASGDLTISPAGADVFINGNLAAQRSAITTVATYSSNDTAANGPRFAFHRSGGALGTETATQSGQMLGALSYRGHTGSGYMAAGATEIRSYASENFTTTATGANLRFYTTTSGTTSISERMRIHNTGNVSILNTTDNGFALDVTGAARITTSLTTPLLTTASNVDLVINPAGTGAVQFPNDQTLRTTSFDSSFPINGWQINEVAGVSGYSALTIGKIQADELAVRVFVADEVRVDRGDEFWTKSYGIVAATFTTPGTIGGTVSVKFEDSPALAGAIFVNNDWVLIRKLEIDTGITLFNVWGQVATYVNNSDGTQNWTFTLRSGPTATEITKGSLAIDFGASGAALIHLSVIDAAGAPYIKMRKWAGSNPYTPANFTTYVQLGHLGSTGNAYVTPAGFGLYARSTNDESRFILSDDNGLQIRGAAFKMYNSTLQTVDISATDGSVKLGTDISSATTTSFDFDGATGDLAIKGSLEAASGDVLINNDGVRVRSSATLTYSDVNAYRFENADDYAMGGMYAALDSTQHIVQVRGIGDGTRAGKTFVFAANNEPTIASKEAYILLSADNTAGTITLAADDYILVADEMRFTGTPRATLNTSTDLGTSSVRWATVYAATFNASSGVDVTGNIAVSGTVDGVDVAAFKSAYDSHNHNSAYLALSGGTLTGTLTSRDITFSADNTYDIGSAGARVQDLYVVNLRADTIVGTPSYSHSHAASDITSGTLDFARIPTTWTGALTLDADSAGTSNYIRWLTQTSTSKAWDLVGRAHDYATASQQNDLLLTYYDGATTYVAFQADSATRVIDFGQTPTVSGTAVVLTSRTVTAGSAMTGGGALSGDITISHADTSTQASVNNSGMTFIQDVTLDTYGHVTALTSTDVSTVLTGYVKTDGTTDGATSQAQAFNTGVIAIAPDATTSQLTLRSTRAAIVTDNVIGGIDFQSNDTNQTAPGTVSASIKALASATHTASQLRTDIVFYTTTGTTYGESLRIGGAGTITALAATVVKLSSTTALDIENSSGTSVFTVNTSTPGATVAGTLSVTGTLTGAAAAFSGTVTTPTVSTASGNLSLTSTGGTVAVTGALTGSSTAAFTTSVSTPSLITASGTLTIAPANSTTAITGALSLTGTLSSASWGITSGGAATLVTAAASTSVTTPTVTTASGNLTLTSAGGTVAVTGALTGSSTAAFTTSISAPLVTAASGNLTVSAPATLYLNAATGNTVDLQINSVSQWSANADRLNPRGSVLVDIGDINRKVRSLHAAELRVETLVAENVMATIGGRIIVAPTTKLIADFGTSAPIPLWTNIISWWSLDEASGNRADSKGGNTLTDTNTVASTIGKLGNAGLFVKANSERLTIADNAALSVGDIDFYIAAWVYPTLDDGASQHTIAGKAGSSGNRAWYLYIDWAANQAKFRVFDPTDASTTVTASTFGNLSINTWYFVEAWHDSVNNQITIAVNGTSTTASHTIGCRDDTGAFQIGAANSSSHFDGYIDEVVFAKYIPTSAERAYLYNAGTGRTYSEIAALHTIDVEHNQWAAGDYVYMATAPAGIAQIEALKAISGPETITGGYRYWVHRNLDGTGANTWYAGDAAINIGGVAGEGYLELTATQTIHGHYGPTTTYYVRTATANWNDVKPVVTQGNLRSFVDYVSDEFGTAAGNDLTLTPATGFNGYALDRVNGLRLFNAAVSMYSGANKIIGLDATRGLDIEIDTADGDSNRAISYRSSGVTYNWLKAYNTGGWQYLKMAAEPIAGLNNAVILRTSAAASQESSIFLSTTNAAGSTTTNYAYLHHKADGTGEMELSSDSVTIFGAVTLSSGVGTQLTVGGPSLFNGNVGIGVTASYKLDVGDRARFRSGGSGTAGAWFSDSAGNNRAFVGLNTDGSTPIWGVYNNGDWRLLINHDGNVAIGTTASFGGGGNVVFIANATTVPSSNPTGGGVLYVQGGALKFRGSSGTVTTIAAA